MPTTNILGIYAPHSNNSFFSDSLQPLAKPLALKNPMVLIRDFNVCTGKLDKRNPKGYLSPHMCNMVARCSLQDAFHALHPDTCTYSWTCTTLDSNIQAMRIDTALTSPHVTTLHATYSPTLVDMDHLLNHFKRISTILNPKTNSLPTNVLSPTLELVSEPNEIKRVTHNFWKLMFAKPPAPNGPLPSCYTKTRPRLTIHDSERITRPIMAKELNLVLKCIKTNSAPGPDEINNAMLKALDEPNWLELLAFVNNALSDPTLLPGMNESKLWTIYKWNNKANLNNY
jgi:hypothetical protein